MEDKVNLEIKHGIEGIPYDSIVRKAYDSTLGSEISSVEPNKLSVNDYISVLEKKISELEKLVKEYIPEDCYLYDSGYMWYEGALFSNPYYAVLKKALKIDDSKPMTRELVEEDYKIIKEECGVSAQDMIDDKVDCGISDRDDNIFIIRTKPETWMSLCGREWHYNLETREIKLMWLN